MNTSVTAEKAAHRGSGALLVATLTSPPTHTTPVAAAVLDEALAALCWTADLLDTGYPAHVAYGGNDHLVLAVRDREVLAGPDHDREEPDHGDARSS